MHLNKKSILVTGILGMTGALLAVIADIYSGYAPSVMFDSYNISNLKVDTLRPLLVAKPFNDLLIGHYLAIVFIPLSLIGVWQIYHALRPGRSSLAAIILITSGFAYFVATVFHSTFAFMATALQAQQQIAHADGHMAILNLISQFKLLHEPLGYMMLGLIVFISILMMQSIWFENTRYPKWMTFVNPLTIQLLLILVIVVLPHPFNQALFVAVFNTSMFLLFLVSTLVLVKQESKNPPMGSDL